jgi:hypothetical protein
VQGLPGTQHPAPSTKHHAPSTFFFGGIICHNTYISSNTGIGTATPLGLLQVGVGATSPFFVKLSDGNVGIGTTGPGKKLDIYDGTDPRIRISAANNTDPILELYDVGAGAAKGWFYYSDSADIVIAKHASGGNQLVLKSDGNVGIG